MSAAVRLATIDLGTNTVRLLVADVGPDRRWRVVEADQRVTRLGEGLTATGRLGDAPVARTTATVSEYVARARRAGSTRLAIVATSALREAANGRDVAAALERTTGEPVTIVSGGDEAAFTLRGVLAGVGRADGPSIVFDIGGGSTEYILARDTRPAAAVSLRLGVVDLAERHPFPGPVEPRRYAALHDEIVARLIREVPPEIRTARPARLVGTAGTATTLAALDLGLDRYDAGRVQGHTVTRQAVDRLLARLGALTIGERAALPCLEPGRADLIVPGTAIVQVTMEMIGVERMVVSDWGLREGVLLAMAEGSPS